MPPLWGEAPEWYSSQNAVKRLSIFESYRWIVFKTGTNLPFNELWTNLFNTSRFFQRGLNSWNKKLFYVWLDNKPCQQCKSLKKKNRQINKQGPWHGSNMPTWSQQAWARHEPWACWELCPTTTDSWWVRTDARQGGGVHRHGARCQQFGRKYYKPLGKYKRQVFSKGLSEKTKHCSMYKVLSSLLFTLVL